MARLLERLRALRHGRRREADLDEEIAFHLEEEAEARAADGLSPDAARFAARRDFGNVTLTRETTREVWVWRTLEQLAQDVRFGWRALMATPAVSLVAILSLALGIGATTAIFSVTDALLLRPLPVRTPDRLTLLTDEAGLRRAWTSPIWAEIQRRPDLADGAFAVSATRFNLAERGETDMVDGLWASGDTFDLLGVRAVLGRTFTADDDRPGGGPDGAVAVISEAFWRRRFAASPDVLGRRLTIERTPFTIVGVAPASFFGLSVGRTFEVAAPIGAITLVQGPRALEGRSRWWLRIFLRLKPGQSPDALSAALRAIQPQIREATLPTDWHAFELPKFLREPLRAEPAPTGDSGLRTRYRRPLYTILAVVVLVLLIACANLANLLLARGAARRRELSVRVALGAPRLRLVRQLLTESLLLAALGAAAGLVVAYWGSHLLVQQLSTSDDPVFLDLAINLRVLAFTLTAAVATALVFGVAPALRGARTAPVDALRAQGRGAAGDAPAGLGHTLVAVQVALSLVLLVGAGAFLRTFVSLATLDPGFDVQPILVTTIQMPARSVPADQRPRVLSGVVDAVSALPGVQSVAVSTKTPLDNSTWSNLIELPGKPPMSPADRLTWFNAIGPGWFRAYGTPFIAGRDFERRDTLTTAPVAIVNEAFARRYTGGRNPIGLRVKHPWNIEREVVGYVKDAVHEGLREPVPPTLYVLYTQQNELPEFVSLTVRVAGGSPVTLASPVAAAIAGVSRDMVISSRPLSEQLRAVLVQERVMAMLSTFFGVVALLLAGLGLYGITMHAVSRRRSEMGVRLALGASPGSVARLVLRRVAILVGVGAVAGAIVSLWAVRLVAPLLYAGAGRAAPDDPLTFAGAGIVLAAIGLIAGWVPARTAARLDAARILRDG